MLNTPLIIGYYDHVGWHGSLVRYYNKQDENLSEDILLAPLKTLTDSVYVAIETYGNFPDVVYSALGQCVDPFLYAAEYKKNVYDILIKSGKEENNKYVISYAEALLAIHKIFQRDESFYMQNFQKEINLCQGTQEEKFFYFSSNMQKITKIHINQIRRMIKNRTE
jgi:hypothetical protein